jgi:phage baseplate assembly protein W|tara:strand:+ start:22411 stop:22815 length:405 start_codon:yes stop_codon:yes gene_type:complete
MAQTVTRKTANFSDLDFNFTLLSSTKDVARKTDVEAVKQSMRALIQTNYFDRPFHPELGCSVTGLLFENNTPMTRRSIRKSVEEVLQNYEPRCEVTEVDVTDGSDVNEYRVRIYFYVVNHTQQEVFETYLARTR